MATARKVKHKPAVTDKVTIDEAYFLLRTAMWDMDDFTEYTGLFEARGYQAGYDDGHAYASETNDSEVEYERGYEKGYKDGQNEGFNEGYDEGYTSASHDGEYRR